MKRILAILAMAAAAQATAITYHPKSVPYYANAVMLTGYSGSVPANLEIPSKIGGKTVVGIGAEFMEDCQSLKSLTLPSTIRFIEEGAFDDCENLATLNLNEGLECIYGDAFDGLRSLKKLVIPSTVTYISEDAFSYSGSEYGAITGIQSITIRGGNNAYYKVVGGMLYDVQRKVVIAACTNIESAKIPSDCVAIGHEAFATCRKLKSVTFPSSLERIGGCAFDCCFALKTVDLSKTKLASIGNMSFSACTALTEVRFPATLKEVGVYLFAHALALKSVYYNGNAPKVNADLGWGGEDLEDNDPYFPKGDIYVAHKGKLDFTQDDDYFLDTRLTGVTSYVLKGTSGWGAVPGKWQGCPTSYVTYTVKFDANGGTGTMKAQALAYGDSKPLTANAFKRTNYHFKGWSKTKGGKLAYTDKQTVKNLATKAGATVTLYAVWERSTYKVAFNANGGTGTMKTLAVNVGAAKVLTANAFKRTGYTFLGWSKTKTATSAAYKDKASVKDLATKNGATVTLYAVWKANAYTVKFDGNGGTGKMANLAMTYGKAKALTANAFKRANFSFLGWSTSKTATAATYANKASVKNLKASGTVTLYAVWKRNTYSIAFDANGGAGTMSKQTLNAGASVALTANAFKRAGYEFKGWATTAENAKSGKVAYTNKAKVKDLVKKDDTQKLYAVWSLPVWAMGTFNGWCAYWSPAEETDFDGVSVATVSSLGKLSGSLTFEKAGGGTATVKFSANEFDEYHSNLPIEDLFDLLDYDEDDDPYGIVEDVEDDVAPSSVKAYVYENVSFNLPDGTKRTDDLVLLSWTYDGKVVRGGLFLSNDSGLQVDLVQNLFVSKHATLPTFDGTPKKSFNVTSELREEEDFPSNLTKVEVTFGANGKLTVVGYKGTTKKWTTTATLRLFRYDGTEFDAGTDFLTPDGDQLWFDCFLKPGKNGKITASGITFFW